MPLLLIVLLPLAGLPGSPVVRPALAASDPLVLDGATTYSLDPAAGAIHAATDYRLTDMTPNSSAFIYFYMSYTVVVQPEATHIQVTDAKGALKFTTSPVAGSEDTKKHLIYFPGTAVTFTFRSALFYKQTLKFRVAYELGGTARSSSDVRAGAAFARFAVWPFGRDGHASMTVIVPKGFSTQIGHSPLSESHPADGRTILTASPSTVENFWSLITAERADAYAVRTITLPQGGSVRLESYPEDAAWARDVGDAIEKALPGVRDLTGVPGNTGSPLVLRERFEPDLMKVRSYGYDPTAGYGQSPISDPNVVGLSESRDAFVALSRVAAATFRDVFVPRWAQFGLGQEYAAEALTAVDTKARTPIAPEGDTPGRQELDLWGPVAFTGIDDYRTAAEKAASRDAYGLSASWYVAHQLVDEIGTSRMKAVIGSAVADQIAYVGAGTPEKVASGDDWQRLLDLFQEVGGSTKADGLFRQLVLTVDEAKALDARAKAREAYDTLVADPKGWRPPYVVRKPMSDWTFTQATTAIDAAKALLGTRDQVATAAAGLDLTPGPALKAAYEGASAGFDKATALGKQELATLDAIAKARAAIGADRDLFTSIGLIGEDPKPDYDRAVTAYQADDLTAANAAVNAASAMLSQAPEVGRQRVMVAAATVAALFVLLVVGYFVIRRRRRRVAPTAVLAGAIPMASASVPAESMPLAETASPSGAIPMANPSAPAETMPLAETATSSEATHVSEATPQGQ